MTTRPAFITVTAAAACSQCRASAGHSCHDRRGVDLPAPHAQRFRDYAAREVA